MNPRFLNALLLGMPVAIDAFRAIRARKKARTAEAKRKAEQQLWDAAIKAAKRRGT